MKIRREFIGDVRRGEKTEHRFPFEGRCRFRVGHFYVIRRVEDVRVENPDGSVSYQTISMLLNEHVEITLVRRQRVADVSDADALAEGFESADEWREWFFAEYGDGVSEVWAIRFELASDMPRLLATRGTAYTTSSYMALRHEPEAVGDDYLEQFAADAEAAGALLREAKSLAERVAQLEACPDTGGHELASLRKRIEQVERRRDRRRDH